MVVLLDFSSGGPGELSVRCGQTVELVERSAERPGWCLARTTDQTPQQVTEGRALRWKGLCRTRDGEQTRFLNDLEDKNKAPQIKIIFLTSDLFQIISIKLEGTSFSDPMAVKPITH